MTIENISESIELIGRNMLIHEWEKETILEALEKQMPMTPFFYDGDWIGSETFSGYKCQHCKSFVSKEMNYCSICGQKLDWGE